MDKISKVPDLTKDSNLPPIFPINYNLSGPQVEPEASYWFRCPSLRIVSLEEVRFVLEHPSLPDSEKIKSYPPNNSQEAQAELQELKQLFDDRENPAAFDQNDLSIFLKDPIYLPPPTPIGAVLSRRRGVDSIILNGGELARLFEAETPGLWHRHLLNVLFDPQDSQSLGRQFSPPRQALIWAALDVAIASALMAAWHYKWLGRADISRRPRPVEWFPPEDRDKVLYDYEVVRDGTGNIIVDLNQKKPLPQLPPGIPPPFSPGTPRHPAYPSGHSTYAAAASYVLGKLIPTYEEEFTKLAENIGIARLWGGIHWRSDHVEGQKIGKAVGKLVIQQLSRSGIPNSPTIPPALTPPSITDLEQQAVAFNANCGRIVSKSNFENTVDPFSIDTGGQGRQG